MRNKRIIQLAGCLALAMTQSSITMSVASVLIGLIFSAICMRTEDKRVKTALLILFVLCMYLIPVLSLFLPLMGYELRSKLHVIESTTFVDRLRAEYAFVSNNVEKLREFMLTPQYLGLEEDARNDLKTQYDAMIPYMEILNTRLSKLGV